MSGFFTKGRVALIVALIILFAFMKFSGLTTLLTFEQIKMHRDLLLGEVNANYIPSVALYVVVYIAVTAFSLPGAAILALGGGFLFGTFQATIFVNVGATLGAACAFLITRYIVGGWMHNRFGENLTKFNSEIEQNGTYYLLTVRFIPVFPFFLINILAGLTKIPLKTFLWTTAVGILPGDIAYTFAGSQLGTIDSPGDIMSVNIIIAFLFLGMVSLIPAVVNKNRRKKVV